MALSKSTWLTGVKYLRFGLLKNHGPILLRPVLIKPENSPAFRNLFYKSPGSTMDALGIWKFLEFVGMDYCRIVRIRRRMKRFSYPWLAYCVPTALILAIGDFIAQYHLRPHETSRTFKKFLTEEWKISETLLFALVGFFPVGYLLSKWNLFLYRKLRCHGKFSFLFTKLLLDLLILSPILLSLMILAYSASYDQNTFKKLTESSENIKQIFKQKYWPAIKDAMIFNAMTRPLALFAIFYLAPVHLRRLLKTIYEVIFAIYVTASIRENVHESSSSSTERLASVSPSEKTLFSSRESLIDKPIHSRWARYKKWACRNRED